jgi:two-component system, OmpR family, phosphate regulon response regulator PhoB
MGPIDPAVLLGLAGVPYVVALVEVIKRLPLRPQPTVPAWPNGCRALARSDDPAPRTDPSTHPFEAGRDVPPVSKVGAALLASSGATMSVAPSKILVADDESKIRRLVSATLSGGDFQVVEAKDGAEALELIRRERPGVVLLDIQMPVLDGIEVCRRVKADPTLRGTYVVILTARAQPDARSGAAAAGADRFLTKPFSPIGLLELVNGQTRARPQ